MKQIVAELRAEHAKLHRAIEDLERLYGYPTPVAPPRIVVKRMGRPRKDRAVPSKTLQT